MSIQYDKVFRWLETVEGALTCRGYIPCRRRSGGTANYTGREPVTDYEAMGASGVTVGVGVDLGQQSASQLRSWGVSDGTIDAILIYIGLQRGAALRALRNRPLTLTVEQARELTDAEHRGYMDDVVVPWWGRGRHTLPYTDLPWQAQAVVFSLLYQCGVRGAERRAPVTLAALRRGDWKKASAALLDRDGWGGEYLGRRAAEGRLLAGLCAELEEYR